MSDSQSPHVVLGATGGAGRAVVKELADRNHPVRAVSRSGGSGFPKGVEIVPADCTDADAARQVATSTAPTPTRRPASSSSRPSWTARRPRGSDRSTPRTR